MEVSALSINVTAPFRAQRVPLLLAWPSTEIDVYAKTFPSNDVDAPIVADEPTMKNTLQAWAPLIKTTLELAYGRHFRVSIPLLEGLESKMHVSGVMRHSLF